MWSTRSAGALKFDILDTLRSLGATEMEASYSGGNDEGGVDGVDVYRPVTKENPAFLVYELHLVGYGPDKGELRRQYYPASIGPYTSEADAREGAKAAGFKRGQYEIVKVTEKRVPLVAADVGDYASGLHGLVDDLLSIDFGTWAGDFSAHGTIYADVPTQRVWRSGEVSGYSNDSSAGEY